MAVVKAPYAHSKPELWETGCNDFLSDPYAFNMSYQYMAPPTSQLGMDLSQPGYSSGFKMPSQDPSALAGDCKEPQGSYEEQKPGVSLRRSFSTPNAAQMQQSTQEAQSQAGATSEKKRNKLGYHRTSIACKCSFYPVDQQPGGESRSRAPARQAAGSSSVASTNSSPAVATGSPGEMASHHGHASVSGIPQSSKAQAAGGDELYPPEVKVPSNGMAAGQYSFADQPPTTWMADVNSTSISKPENLNMSWPSYAAESPIGTQFSPYTQSSAASATWASGNSEAGSHDEMAWSDYPPPARSMSLSGESSGSHQQLQYLAVGQGQPFDRRQSVLSDLYTQPFGAPVASMTSGSVAGIESSGPMVTATLPSNAESWQQPVHSQSQNPYAKPAAMFDGWQYDKAGEGQQMWLEEQRPPSTTAQVSSEAYYSA
ncbi:Fungal Zn binuclear cluster domain containing protein [Ophiocordyceps sinensis CO18]|uniref:Fungal Zn binuclear cluster domain containing protein n=1 Tax=Ophiocordyceps sinensis (strain Co18 / CGMCC 3.14243) TaxID=911162 RepID=T5AE02_OPHSC|nr:Fungal Zn binuclear cluster domain containing protein [Ophiocordyceps sinensis CO18]